MFISLIVHSLPEQPFLLVRNRTRTELPRKHAESIKADQNAIKHSVTELPSLNSTKGFAL